MLGGEEKHSDLEGVEREFSDFGGRRERVRVVDFVFLFCVLIEVSYFLMIMFMSLIMIMCE